MKVVIDNNLPMSLARLLGAAGGEAVHIHALGLANASDHALRRHFAGEQMIFVSRDDDFWVDHPSEWAVIWIALHNPTLAQLKGPVARVLVHIIPQLRPGQRVLFAADQVRIFDPS